jgi:hypothetical protein
MCKKGKFREMGEKPRLFGGQQGTEMFIIFNYPTLRCDKCKSETFIENRKIRIQIARAMLGEIEVSQIIKIKGFKI